MFNKKVSLVALVSFVIFCLCTTVDGSASDQKYVQRLKGDAKRKLHTRRDKDSMSRRDKNSRSRISARGGSKSKDKRNKKSGKSSKNEIAERIRFATNKGSKKSGKSSKSENAERIRFATNKGSKKGSKSSKASTRQRIRKSSGPHVHPSTADSGSDSSSWEFARFERDESSEGSSSQGKYEYARSRWTDFP